MISLKEPDPFTDQVTPIKTCILPSIEMEDPEGNDVILVGDLVSVKARSGPHLNVQGGVGWVEHVHEDGFIDVSLVLGGRLKRLGKEFYSIFNNAPKDEISSAMRISSTRKRKRIVAQDATVVPKVSKTSQSEIYKLATRLAKLDKHGFFDENLIDDSLEESANNSQRPMTMGALILRAGTDYYDTSTLPALNWDLFMADINYLCSLTPPADYSDKDLKQFTDTVEKILTTAASVIDRSKAKDLATFGNKESLKAVQSYQSRNDQPAVSSRAQTTAYPLRKYNSLSSYVAGNCMSPHEQTLVMNELDTQLDGFVGQAYNYDDAELSEGWMCGLLESSGKERSSKGRNAKAHSMMLKAHVRTILDGMVNQVVDSVRNDDGVLRRDQCRLGIDCEERPVWGFDCYSRRNIEIAIQDRYPGIKGLNDLIRDFVESVLLVTINRQNLDDAHDIRHALIEIRDSPNDSVLLYRDFADCVLTAVNLMTLDHFRVLPKGTGVICTVPEGIPSNSFVTEYLGEIFSSWRWCEKQDAIEAAQKKFKFKPALPDFYNMLLERPRLDKRGYGLIYIDASRCANFGSSCSHSCNSNCVTCVVAINGKLTVALVTVRDVKYGEELTIDYNSVTTSESEYQAAICLCGSMSCRGSFLRFGTQDELQQIITKNNGPAFRFAALLLSSVATCVPHVMTSSFKTHGIGESMLGTTSTNQHIWMQHFVSKQIQFIEFERSALPQALLRPMHHGKRMLMSRGLPDSESSSSKTKKKKKCLEEEDRYDFLGADIDSRLVMEQRIQSLACCLSNVNHVLGCQPKKSQSYVPLSPMTEFDVIRGVWSDDDSIVESFLHAINAYVTASPASDSVTKLKELHGRLEACCRSMVVHDLKQMRAACLAVRDLLVACHPASIGPFRLALAGHVLTLWSFTTTFVNINLLHTMESSPVSVRARELGCSIKKCDVKVNKDDEEDGKPDVDLNEACDADDVVFSWKKSYKKDFCFWQLMHWFNNGQGTRDIDLLGCLCLPRLVDCVVSADCCVAVDISDEAFVRAMIPYLSNEKLRAHPFPDAARKLFDLSGNACLSFDDSCSNVIDDSVTKKRYRKQTKSSSTSTTSYYRHSLIGSPILDSILGDDFNLTQVIATFSSTCNSSTSTKKAPIIALPTVDEASDRTPPVPNCQWVLCSRCLKWRRLPWNVNQSSLPEDWYCEMNYWNTSIASCDAQQDDYDPEVELTMDMSSAAASSTYSIGNDYDVYHPLTKKHYRARILEIDGSRALFSFPALGSHSRHDDDDDAVEWIGIGSTRIFPAGTKKVVIQEDVKEEVAVKPKRRVLSSAVRDYDDDGKHRASTRVKGEDDGRIAPKMIVEIT